MQKATDLTEEQWKAIDSIAEQTNCTYRGQPSWTKLLKRLALGQITVTEVSPSAEPDKPVDLSGPSHCTRADGSVMTNADLQAFKANTYGFGKGTTPDAYL